MTPGAPAARAVIDPGVFISALLSSRGAPDELVRALEAGSFESVVSTALIGELERVLRRPKFAEKIHDEDITLFVDFVRSASILLDDPPARTGLAPDPGDDYLVALADAAEATHLVTGDQALLTVRGLGYTVSTPRHFVRDVLGESSKP
ncbi:MAG: putative toxin-antitoxin system toxin component, PIN family [Actinomycetota bacterium]|nr:putative toxin-antitoxin system toxin component, PIN family [Actinomycetota bacterium]